MEPIFNKKDIVILKNELNSLKNELIIIMNVNSNRTFEKRQQRRAIWYQTYLHHTILSNSTRLERDVPVVNNGIKTLTKLQIDCITDRYIMSNTNHVIPDEHDCPICFSFLKSSVGSQNDDEPLSCLPCDHIFHTSCVKMWFYKQSSCPSCRFKVF